MSDYKIVNFANGQIMLAFDGKQVNFPLPIVDGAYPTGADLTALLDRYVANARVAAAAAIPTASNEDAIKSLVVAPSTEQLAAAYKLQRDQLLRITDFTVLPGSPYAAQQSAWEAYRQALRDLTSAPGFPTSFSWPVPPVILTNARGLPIVNADGSPTVPLRIIW